MTDQEVIKTLTTPPGDRTSGQSVESMALHESILAGLSTAALKPVKQQLDLTDEQLAKLLGIHASTLSDRRRSGSLTTDESNRLVRIARVLGTARTVLGDDAVSWLNREQYALGGRIPRNLLSTGPGCRMVENTLQRIEHGVCL